MSRPGFVLEVDGSTPALLIPEGAGCRLEKLPIGSKVAYPAESLPSLPDLNEAIGQAFALPLDTKPLTALLTADTKVVITFTDNTRPVPAASRPDVRTRIIEQLLELAAGAGVDRVSLVAANGLARRMNSDELLTLLGERVHRSFHPQGALTSHDAEAPADSFVDVGSAGSPVLLNREVAEADLVINVVVATSPSHAGWHQLATGTTAASTAWPLVGGADAPSSLAGSTAEVPGIDAVGKAIAGATNVFQVEVVLDQNLYPPKLAFYGRREWEWKLRDQASLMGLRQALTMAPQRVRRMFFENAHAPYGVLAVHAGAVDSVAAQTRELLARQQNVKLDGQSDVVIAGPASATEHNANAVMNPLIAAWDTLARTFGSHTGTPAVREGGAMILFHPLMPAFNSRFHSASSDFFNSVLPRTVDASRIGEEFEQKFLADPWYTNLYRNQSAFHGSHPLQLWNAIAPAVRHCGDIIWVGADRHTAERLGFRAATTLADALEIASATVGRTPSITYLHTPPALVADVDAGGGR